MRSKATSVEAPYENDFIKVVEKLSEDVQRLQRTVRDLQSVHGGVAADGTIMHGNQSFSVVHNSTGDYTITFDDPFDDHPSVIVGINHELVDHDVGGFNVVVYDQTGVQTDRDFHFLAIHS